MTDSIEHDGVAIDAVAGAVAGAAAIWVLDRVDWFAYTSGYLDDEESRRRTEAVRPGGMDPGHVAASRIARGMGLAPPAPAKHNPYGMAVHYSFGVVPGAIYGALRDRAPYVDAGRGAAFGLGVFLVHDELLNTALGLSAPPRAYPWQAHARGVVAHLVFGLVTDTLLRVMRPRRRGDRRSRPHEAALERRYAD